MVCVGYVCHYSWEMFTGADAFFCGLPLWSLNASWAKLERFSSEGNPMQNGLLHCTQSSGTPPAGSGS